MRLRKYIIDGEWQIAIKKMGSTNYTLIPNLFNYWFADPFVVEVNDKVFVFCEGYNKLKDIGSIFCIDLNGKKTVYREIIKQKYHLSYPNIFKYNGEYYLIPESSENKTVELYKCSNFPYKWDKVSDLLIDIHCVDTDIQIRESSIDLVTQELIEGRKYFSIYNYNFNTKLLTLISKEEDANDEHRNGGNIYVENGQSIRPTQYMGEYYGEKIILRVHKGKIEDCKPIGEIRPKDIKDLSTSGLNITRVHTYNRSANYEIVDFYKSYFNPLLIFKKIKEVIIVKIRK